MVCRNFWLTILYSTLLRTAYSHQHYRSYPVRRLQQVAFHSSRVSLPRPVAQTSRSRRRQLCQLHLFALNLYGGKKQNNDNKDGDEEEGDMPSWVNALRQWPRFPAQRSSRNQVVAPPALDEETEASLLTNNVSEKDNKSFFFALRVPTPLASLANVEALLLASSNQFERLDTPPLDVNDPKTVPEQMDSLEITDSDTHAQGNELLPTAWSILPEIEELSYWDNWIGAMQRSLSDLTLEAASKVRTNGTLPLANAADSILKDATARIEYLVTEVSTALSPATLQDLILRASKALEERPDTLDTPSTGINGKGAKRLSTEGSTELERETSKNAAARLVTLANNVLTAGYATNDASTTPFAKPLFADFASAQLLTSTHSVQMTKAAEMGALAGAIYQETLPRTHALGHTFVANGTNADVTWMVTDAIANPQDYQEPSLVNPADQQTPIFVRTLTIRGFDASDDRVDRERLLNVICSATPDRLSERQVLAHAGLLSVAREVYAEIKKYITWTAPSHRIVMNGHSVGGSIAILMLLLLVEEFGAEFVERKILRVFTFGSPPVTTTTYKPVRTPKLKNIDYLDMLGRRNLYDCDVLKEYDLPSSLVCGFAQPWDPIVRLFSEIDSLYPLVNDVGPDGVTVYASGPPRSLRPIVRAIVESWEGWPLFRNNFRSFGQQNYTSVGVQHVLLAEPLRYLSDRLVGANIGVPPVESVLRISSSELLPALQQNFPLDVFQISFVPAAIRGFVHHFYPAYGDPVVDFASKLAKTLEVATTQKDLVVMEEPAEVRRNGAKLPSRTELYLSWSGRWITNGFNRKKAANERRRA